MNKYKQGLYQIAVKQTMPEIPLKIRELRIKLIETDGIDYRLSVIS
jgi:hypothetical protein